MPFNYAHALLALKAAEAAKSAPVWIAACPPAFRAGAMGPDPYFADSMPKPCFRPARDDLACRMHGLDAGVLFLNLFSLAETPVQRAYALGFLCHFLLDDHAHPFIFARFPGAAHTPGEMHMDLPFCDLSGAPLAAEKPWRLFRLSRRELQEIDALHAALVRALFFEDSRGVFARSYRKWVYFINRLSFDPQAKKLRFLSRAEARMQRPGLLTAKLVTRDPADAAKDLMNLLHTPWAAPWSPADVRTESFADLFDAALYEAPSRLDAAVDGFASGDFSLLAGALNGRCMNGQPPV